MKPERGFSLVEIMVATTLGLIVLGGVSSIFLNGSRNNAQDTNISLMLDELSYTLSQLNRDLEMAGYWGRVHDPTAIRRHASATLADDCGAAGEDWAYGNLTALSVVDNATASGAVARHRCIPAGAVRDGTDVLTIKRLVGRVAATDQDPAGLVAGRSYLRTQGVHGTLYVHGVGNPADVVAPYENREYRPVVYFIQRYARSAAETPAVPSLCRMALAPDAAAKPAFTRECLAQGVENLQIEVGVDSDGDGVANYFASDPDAAMLRNAVAVRLYVLVRSRNRDVHYRNEKTYLVGNANPFKPSGADVHYYRKTLTTEVVLRNPRSLQGVAFR